MKAFRAVLALGLALILAACYPPVTTQPVGMTTGIRNDPALAGTWRALPDGDGKHGGYFHFLPRLGGGFLVVAIPNNGGVDADVVTAFATSAPLGHGTGYLNVFLANEKGERLADDPPGTIPVLYRFDGKGQLLLYLPDEDATKALIRAHRLAGDPGKSDTGDAVITAGARTLDAFFGSPAGRALYKKPFAVLRRSD